ncbi:MAG: DUF3152 domain-containing protein [Micromonosporaceae bacterium]
MTAPDSWPDDRPTRLERKQLARRRMVRRRRRAAVFTLLLVAALVAGFDFARGGIGPPEPPVRARGSATPTPPPSSAPPSPTPSPSAAPTTSGPPSVPYSGSGNFTTAAGQSAVLGRGGSLLRYRVQVEQGSGQDAAEFAEYVDTTLADKRSWIAGGNVRFQRTPSGPYDFTVYLATPTTTDRLCAPLPTSGYTSCRQGDNVVVNLARWLLGVPHWDSELETYRRYVVNHEVGHRVGHQHVLCSGKGDPAPVMQQQTLKLAGCKGNAWPYVNGKLHTGPAGQYS